MRATTEKRGLLPVRLLLLCLFSNAICGHKNGGPTKSNPPASAKTTTTTPAAPVSARQLCVLENERSAFYVSIAESTPKGAILGPVPVNGISSGPHQNIRLRLVRGREFVRLNAMSKQLVLRKEVDREQQDSPGRLEAVIECVPVATNGSAAAAASEALPLNISVFVTVTDVNDNAPTFAQQGLFRISIPEELPEGTPIRLEFGATDRDQPGPNSHIRYRIVRPVTDPDQSKPPIDSLEAPFFLSYTDLNDDDASTLLAIPDPYRPELVVAGRIDFERTPNFTVLIEAEDQGMPKLRALAKLEVNVLDIDDLNPVFSASVYTAKGVKGSQLELDPGPIEAWDADRTFNDTIVYAISGEHSVNYAIDELTGAVRLLSDELVPTNLIITASQLNRPERNATALLVVEVPAESTKVHEFCQVVRENFILRMPSNLPIGTTLVNLEELAANNGTARIELGDQNSPSQIVLIDHMARTVRLAKPLEVGGDYRVSVVIDSADEPPSQHTVELLLIVFDPVEWSRLLPRFEKAIYEFELDWDTHRSEKGEFITIGQTTAVSSESPESGQSPGPSLMYTLLNGNEYFDVDSDSGSLKVRNQFNKENQMMAAGLEKRSELVVMVEDAEGRRNFVRCIVRMTNQLSSEPVMASLHIGGVPLALPLGLLCFLLLVTNCATLSLWIGKKHFSTMYDNLAYRYDSPESKSAFEFHTQSSKNSSSSWMMNKALEGDPSVAITTRGTCPIGDLFPGSAMATFRAENAAAAAAAAINSASTREPTTYSSSSTLSESHRKRGGSDGRNKYY